MKRYVDIDSSRRNRQIYPKPGDFVISLGGTYNNNPETAGDPILLAFPYEANRLSGGSTFTQLALSVISSNIVNFYRNSYIEIFGDFRKIIEYDNLTQIATVDVAFPFAYPALTPYTIRREIPFEGPKLTGGASLTPFQVVLNVTSSTSNDYYKGYFLFLPGINAPYSYQWKRIVSYNGATRVATLATPTLGLVGAGVQYEIMKFSYENYLPLRYVGTNSLNSSVCETLRLINVVVPNKRVKGGYGGTLQNYSHVYVSLYSETENSWVSPIISNNSAAHRSLFKVPVSYLPNTDWLTLSLSSMNQNIVFKENDTIHFSILLPTNEVLEFEPSSNFTFFEGLTDPITGAPLPQFPIPSDPGTQIQAVFELTR
jgi:hypothetical protein